MKKPRYFVLLIVSLIVLACLGKTLEPVATSSQTPSTISMPPPSLTPQPTPTEIRVKKSECKNKGHTTTWDLDGDWLNTYVGSIDKENIDLGMTLIYSENFIEGLFFYIDKPDEMKIEGCLEKNRDFTLYLYDGNGERTAVIHGEFPEIDPLGGFNGSKLAREVIVGTWVDELTAEQQSIYLRLDHAIGGTLEHKYEVAGATDDEIIDKAAQDFLNAVASNNKEFVAGMIEYPIYATVGGTQTEIKNQDEFIAYYENIFTNEFKAKLAKTRPKHMFAKWSGIMLGQGEIWFNAHGKVIAINNGGG